MVKKLSKEDFRESSADFGKYLEDNLSAPVFGFLKEISKRTETVIFSGIIRNYFLRYNGGIRDLDVVLKAIDKNTLELITSYEHKKNSFGGFKLRIDSLDVDLWELKNTWALKNDKVDPKLFEELNLPNTSFFNFSAIIYNFNNKEFIYGKDFEKFVSTKELDLVLKENPLPQLCLINTIYYKEKFHLKVAPSLAKYYVTYFDEFYEKDFNDIQIKHFGRIKYSYHFLKTYYKIFSEELTANRS